MKCLMKYEWVKLRRDTLPSGKGIMQAWARLAARAAFRKGHASYCGYRNAVSPGMWSGGIVGLKSILGVRSRSQALATLDRLSALGYLQYTLDACTKKLTYQLTDWVVKCSGEACMEGTVYATEGFGFLCLPRSITQRLAEERYTFEEADAWLDLWCHTVSEDPGNAFSFMAPAVQYGRCGAILTLENWASAGVGKRRKYGDFSKSTGMSLLCTAFPALTAALFLINHIRWIPRFPYLSRQKFCVFSMKYAFAEQIRTRKAVTVSISIGWSHGTAEMPWKSRLAMWKKIALHFQAV